jgi:hypothetical protein
MDLTEAVEFVGAVEKVRLGEDQDAWVDLACETEKWTGLVNLLGAAAEESSSAGRGECLWCGEHYCGGDYCCAACQGHAEWRRVHTMFMWLAVLTLIRLVPSDSAPPELSKLESRLWQMLGERTGVLKFFGER